MRPIRLLLVATVILWSAGVEAQPLIPVSWVKENIGKPGIVFLDLREESLYRLRHVPGAINFPYAYDAWRIRPVGASDPRRSEQLFNARMSELGISNDSRVILIHAGRNAQDVAGTAFVYWHFKVMGHDAVSIMNGGMVTYVREDAPVETLHRDYDFSDYQSRFRPESLARLRDVDAAVTTGAFFIDYRPPQFYLGVSKLEDVARYGTLPNAKNLPADWLTLDGGGMIRPRDQLRRLYDLRDIPVGLPHIAFGSIGELAALGWFVASEIFANANARLYEAGLREWAAEPRRRMHRSISFD